LNGKNLTKDEFDVRVKKLAKVKEKAKYFSPFTGKWM